MCVYLFNICKDARRLYGNAFGGYIHIYLLLRFIETDIYGVNDFFYGIIGSDSMVAAVKNGFT